VEGSISDRVFGHLIDPEHHKGRDQIVIGLARICAGALFVYLGLKLLTLAHSSGWRWLGSGMGLWYLLEVVGFGLVPLVLFVRGIRQRALTLLRVAAVFTLIGIVLNRLNISIIAFKWYAPVRYVPSWMEIEVTLAVVAAELWVLRWVVNRMPVVSASPAWVDEDKRRARREEQMRGEGEPSWSS